MYSVTDRNSDFGFLISDLMDFGIRIYEFGLFLAANSEIENPNSEIQ